MLSFATAANFCLTLLYGQTTPKLNIAAYIVCLRLEKLGPSLDVI